jgi:tetratricopeptide (TPR) repeat protein
MRRMASTQAALFGIALGLCAQPIPPVPPPGRNAVALSALAAGKLDNAAATRLAERRASLFEEARSLCRQAIALDPQNVDALYELGVLGWMQAFPATEAARGRPSARTRVDLTARFWQTIEDAIARFRSVLQLAPTDHHAMTYLSLLFRERAELEPDWDGHQRDIAEADQWLHQAIATAAANDAAGRTIRTRPAPPSISQAFLHYPALQMKELRLIHHVRPDDPKIAREARIQGTVKLRIVVGADGRVSEVHVAVPR